MNNSGHGAASRRWTAFVGGAAAALAAGQAAAETTVSARDLSSLLARCDKPVASVSVGNFACKAAGCQEGGGAALTPGLGSILQMAQAANGLPQQTYPGLGGSMGHAMTTALKATGCFTVQAREEMAELQKEAELAGLKLNITPADYLISGAITSVAVNAKSSTIGGGLVPAFGGLSRNTRTAALGVDVRIVDVRAATIKESKGFSADSTRSSWGVGGLGYGAGGALFGAAHSTASPELDSVANEAVINAANFIAETLAGAAVTQRPAPPQPTRK